MVATERDHSIWDHELLADALPATPEQLEAAPLWTDQCHNLVSVLRLW